MFFKYLLLWILITPVVSFGFEVNNQILTETLPYNSSSYEYLWEEYEFASGDIEGDDILTYGATFGPFHNYKELTEKIIQLNDTFGEIVEVFSIGKTYFGRDIYCVRLTDEKYQEPKTEVLFIAQHHAREQVTVENALYFLDKIAFEWSKGNQTILDILGKKEIYVIPSLNIDGASVIHKFPWQRKTARPLDADGDGIRDEYDGKSHIFEPSDVDGDGFIECYTPEHPNYLGEVIGYEGIDLDSDGKIGEDSIGGVDPNRNYDYGWGNPDYSSDNFNDDTYRGPYPFSENCTARLRDFILDHDFRIAVSLHSGIDELYSPVNAFYEPKEEGDTELYREVTKEISAITGYRHWNMPVGGEAGHWLNWMYWNGEENSNIAICFEIYGNQKALTEKTDYNTGLTILKGVWDYFNPPANKVIENCELIYQALLYLTMVSYYDPKSQGIAFEEGFFFIVFLSTLSLMGVNALITKRMQIRPR